MTRKGETEPDPVAYHGVEDREQDKERTTASGG